MKPSIAAHPADSIYRQHLDKNDANHAPLTPLSFLERTADIYPDHIAIRHAALSYTYSQLRQRCRRLASALVEHGIKPGDTVAAMLPNTPAMIEAHHGVPMAGAVLNALNTRLDAATIALILGHGEARLLITDTEFAPVIRAALAAGRLNIAVIDVEDPQGPIAPGTAGARLGSMTYEAFLAGGDPAFEPLWPADEWQAITLNYTSGTTGNPKGVVYHHRGAHLNAVGNVLAWGMGHHPVYLWTLPMFHCNGWCFPWTICLQAGTHVCLRRVTSETIFEALERFGVTHLCGAPVVMGLIINAAPGLDRQSAKSSQSMDQSADKRRPFARQVRMMTAASAPPAAMLEKIEAIGIEVTHVYGLTEVYGPATVCASHESWQTLDSRARSDKLARQGVRYPVLEGLAVMDPATMTALPNDGATIGEIMMRGHDVMMGYLKNPKATDDAFQGGWFHTGDLAVTHEDGYVEIKDRAKDIVISGGENISTIEIEGALYRHYDVLEAAVVAKPDARWGETPCAFVTLKEGAKVDEAGLIDHCREELARFKAPRYVVFGALPKTSTGKVQKYLLRDRARKV